MKLTPNQMARLRQQLLAKQGLRFRRPVVSHYVVKTCCGGKVRRTWEAVSVAIPGASLSGEASVELNPAG